MEGGREGGRERERERERGRERERERERDGEIGTAAEGRGERVQGVDCRPVRAYPRSSNANHAFKVPLDLLRVPYLLSRTGGRRSPGSGICRATLVDVDHDGVRHSPERDRDREGEGGWEGRREGEGEGGRERGGESDYTQLADSCASIDAPRARCGAASPPLRARRRSAVQGARAGSPFVIRALSSHLCVEPPVHPTRAPARARARARV